MKFLPIFMFEGPPEGLELQGCCGGSSDLKDCAAGHTW